jgi:hypothetical protein
MRSDAMPASAPTGMPTLRCVRPQALCTTPSLSGPRLHLTHRRLLRLRKENCEQMRLGHFGGIMELTNRYSILRERGSIMTYAHPNTSSQAADSYPATYGPIGSWVKSAQKTNARNESHLPNPSPSSSKVFLQRFAETAGLAPRSILATSLCPAGLQEILIGKIYLSVSP